MERAGIIVALEIEATALRAAGGATMRCGPGPARAAAAARSLLGSGAAGLVSFGFAAGLDPRLRAGMVIVATAAVPAGGARFAADMAWRGRIAERIGALAALHAGVIAETTAPLVRPADKAALRAATGADAADMETAAIAHVATDASLPWIAIRAITDGAERGIPGAALAAVDQDGATRPLALLGALARHPAELVSLIATARDGSRALAALRRVAAGCGPGFCLA